jgi:hypothetical protein
MRDGGHKTGIVSREGHIGKITHVYKSRDIKANKTRKQIASNRHANEQETN